jgi:hypothetical protein
MGTTLLDRLNVEVALLAFGLRRLPMDSLLSFRNRAQVWQYAKKTDNGDAGDRFHRFRGVQK